MGFFWLRIDMERYKELRKLYQGNRTHFPLYGWILISNNFLFTSSGMHFLPAFVCAYMALGADMIAFGADHPFETSRESLDSLGILPICDTDKDKFFHRNAEKILHIG